MAVDDTVVYTVTIGYTQNEESDLHYAELKTEMLKRLGETAKQSKGTAEAQLVSIVVT